MYSGFFLCVPPQSRLAPCQLPQGDAFGNAVNFAFTAKSRPLGEGGCERSEQTERVFYRSAALP